MDIRLWPTMAAVCIAFVLFPLVAAPAFAMEPERLRGGQPPRLECRLTYARHKNWGQATGKWRRSRGTAGQLLRRDM